MAVRTRGLALLLIPSFLCSIAAILLVAGISRTPYDTQDSKGRTMGFNDTLSKEHFEIIFRNVRFQELLTLVHAYDGLLLTMHVAGFMVLLSRRNHGPKLRFWFFVAQPLIFPLSFLGILILPVIIGALLAGQLDREGIIDVPFVWCTGQLAWVVTSVAVALALRAGSKPFLSKEGRTQSH